MNDSPTTLNPTECHQAIQNDPNALLIDVRTPAEYREIHAIGAKLEPLDRLDPKQIAERHGFTPESKCYLLCKSGARAEQARRKFVEAGITGVICVEGGTTGWHAAGLPVEFGKKTISLERQVRIAAGSLVMLGVAGGALLTPWLYGLSAFVGAGLVFAGVTDTCGMAMLLARMPWNNLKGRDLLLSEVEVAVNDFAKPNDRTEIFNRYLNEIM